MNAADFLDSHERKRIVILGTGFAGLYAGLELERTVARDSGAEVLLIDPQNFLLFTPMLREVADPRSARAARPRPYERAGARRPAGYSTATAVLEIGYALILKVSA